MKKKIIITAMVLAAVLGGTYFYFKGRRYEVAITQDQIDSALKKHFPLTKKYLLIFTITYSNPEVILLEEGDRIEVGMDATLNIRINDAPKRLGGGATVISGIRYEPGTQEFFLDDAEFDRLEIQGIPEKWSERVTEFASKLATGYVETKPIYRLKATDVKTSAAKMLLKGFEVHGQAVHVTLGI